MSRAEAFAVEGARCSQALSEAQRRGAELEERLKTAAEQLSEAEARGRTAAELAGQCSALREELSRTESGMCCKERKREIEEKNLWTPNVFSPLPDVKPPISNLWIFGQIYMDKGNLLDKRQMSCCTTFVISQSGYLRASVAHCCL
jgi:hypothetical protein